MVSQVEPPGVHVVCQGEWLGRIARAYGFPGIRAIWDHPENEQLRRTRVSPDVLHPGDRVFIPVRTLREQSAETELRHRFRFKSPSEKLRVFLRTEDGQPIRNTKYTLRMLLTSGEAEGAGESTDEGLVAASIPGNTEAVVLSVPRLNLAWTLKVGRLDPLTTERWEAASLQGVQARLNNLGFACGPVDGRPSQELTEAIAAFQRRVLERESATGDLDDETMRALETEHRS